ncbi:MAG: DUF4129 domain-containing protein [Clostridiales bacterium]|nr:DUF4129 domain-containing protein [Clostridiales bacterium]
MIWMFLKKSMQGVVELLTILPILLIIVTPVLSGSHVWLWASFFLIYYIAGILLRMVMKKGSKLLAGFIGMLLSALLAYGIMGWTPSLWISWAIGIILVFRGVNYVDTRWTDMFPTAFLWAGMLVYFCAFLFFKHVETLKPYASGVTWAGFFHVVASLFIFNTKQLKEATLARDMEEPVLPSGVIRHNRLLIVMIFCIILIIANFNRLKNGVLWLAIMIVRGIVEVIVFIGGLLAPSVQQGGGQGQPNIFELFPDAEPRGPSIFDYIFEILAYVLGIAAGVAAAIALLIVLYRGLKKLVLFIKDMILKYLQDREWVAQDGGYVDVKEKLMDLKDLGREYADRLKEWMASLLEREPRWEDLTDIRGKIRYLYRRFLIRCIELGYQPKKHMTPNEIERDIEAWNRDRSRQAKLLTELYNKARYGMQDEEIVEPHKLEEIARELH